MPDPLPYGPRIKGLEIAVKELCDLVETMLPSESARIAGIREVIDTCSGEYEDDLTKLAIACGNHPYEDGR